MVVDVVDVDDVAGVVENVDVVVETLLAVDEKTLFDFSLKILFNLYA